MMVRLKYLLSCSNFSLSVLLTTGTVGPSLMKIVFLTFLGHVSDDEGHTRRILLKKIANNGSC